MTAEQLLRRLNGLPDNARILAIQSAFDEVRERCAKIARSQDDPAYSDEWRSCAVVIATLIEDDGETTARIREGGKVKHG